MAWQRKIPFGYRMEQGALGCERTEAETVKQIFSMYLAGHSMKRIAEAMTEQGVTYHRDKPRWNKNMVKRILDNRKYLGDGEYPRIIRDEDFLAAQQLKEDRNLYAPCHTKISPIKEKLVCGVCGSGMMWLSLGKGAARWKCRNPDCQSAVRFPDSELCGKVDDCLRVIAQTPALLADCEASPPPVQSDVMRLENELVAAFNRGAEIVAAMNEQLVRQTAKEVLKQSIYTALAAAEPEMTLPAVESKIKVLRDRQVELIGLATAEGAKFEDYDEEISRVNEKRLRLLGIRAELEMAEQTNAAFDQRMEEIDAALSQDSSVIEEYDDIRTRQLISNIKVMDKERLLIRFRDGTESVQHIGKVKA